MQEKLIKVFSISFAGSLRASPLADGGILAAFSSLWSALVPLRSLLRFDVSIYLFKIKKLTQ